MPKSSNLIQYRDKTVATTVGFDDTNTNNSDIYQKALAISKDVLKQSASEDGLIAGSHHFKDIWARDSFFASLGSTIYYPGFTKQTLKTFLSFQKSTGELPYRIFKTSQTPLKYFGKSHNIHGLRPNYKNLASSLNFVPDGGLLLLVAFDNYVTLTNDKKFLEVNYAKLLKAIDFYITKTDKTLIQEGYLSGWMDSILKSGTVFYTNLIYYKALESIVHLETIIGRKKEKERHKALLNQVKDTLYDKFYNGEYFIDFIDKKPNDYFETYSNLLAILFNLTTHRESDIILYYIKNYLEDDSKLIKSIYPKYPKTKIYPLNYIIGLSEYHNTNIRWLQPTIVYSIALNKEGYKEKAKTVFKGVANIIVKNKTVYEIFDKDGIPIKKRIYKSERNFSWSAGLYMLAYNEVIDSSQKLSLQKSYTDFVI